MFKGKREIKLYINLLSYVKKKHRKDKSETNDICYFQGMNRNGVKSIGSANGYRAQSYTSITIHFSSQF